MFFKSFDKENSVLSVAAADNSGMRLDVNVLGYDLSDKDAAKKLGLDG